MKILGCIIAGGNSTRMGRDKALTLWRGQTLISHVAERLASQVDQLVINANGNSERFAFLKLTVIADVITTRTPLAGLHAALKFANTHGFDAVLSAPCDTPILPFDLRERLQGDGAAFATSAQQAHYLTGFWPVALVQLFKHPQRRVMDFAVSAKAREVLWQFDNIDPFTNLNTPEDLETFDLAEASQHAAFKDLNEI